MAKQGPRAAGPGKPESDDWSKIQDPRKRKLIQYRLAQRARRQRLARSPKTGSITRAGHALGNRILAPKIASGEDKSYVESGRSDIPSSMAVVARKSATAVSSAEGDFPTFSLPKADSYFLTVPGFSICAALHNNARMQGISCILPTPLFTPPGAIHLPLPLHPIPLQMTIIHLPYIDCLPIPRLRHNLILLKGLVDEEEFCGDLVGTTSFVVMGSQSWDPEGWVIEKEFKNKWFFLFD